MDNVKAVLGAMTVQPQLRELVERRGSEMRDAWKSNAKPMTAATAPELAPLPPSEQLRRAPGYRRHREAGIDAVIRKQERDRELEAGLLVVLDRSETMPGYRSQAAEIVDRVEAGQSVAQIAEEMAIDASTVVRRLRDVRKAAAVAAEAEQLSGSCPPSEPFDYVGPQTPLELWRGKYPTEAPLLAHPPLPARASLRRVNHSRTITSVRDKPVIFTVPLGSLLEALDMLQRHPEREE
jgi:hypothetical protein